MIVLRSLNSISPFSFCNGGGRVWGVEHANFRVFSYDHE